MEPVLSMAEMPTSSADNRSPSEKNCRKRKHSEQSNKENNQSVVVNLNEEISGPPVPYVQPLDINQPSSYVPYSLESGYYGNANIGPYQSPPYVNPYWLYSWYIPGNQLQQSTCTNEIETYDQNYSHTVPYGVITLTSAVLYPPHPSSRITYREKPPGCRTVWVGGVGKKPLPSSVQEVIKDIFNAIDKSVIVRINRKGFCHVQFSCESKVDEALKYAGYQIRVGNINDETHAAWIHVDYAESIEDQKHLEIAKREMLRKARHEILRQIDDTPVVPSFSDRELINLQEQLSRVFSKDEEISRNFKEAVHTFIVWLGRGQLQKKYYGKFYDIIKFIFDNLQKIHRRFTVKRNRVKSQHDEKISNIKLLCSDIQKVMTLAKDQNNLQNKTFISFFEQFENISALIMEQDEKDLCNVEVSSSNSISYAEEFKALQMKIEETEKDIAILVEKIGRPEEEIVKLDQLVKSESVKLDHIRKEYFAMTSRLNLMTKNRTHHTSKNSNIESTNLEEARLLGLIINILMVHPFYINVDYICSYINKIVGPVPSTSIVRLMRRYPSIFQDEVTGVGANMEIKWIIKKVHS